MAKKTNVADTSIECFQQITKEGLIKQEKALIVALMAKLNKPVTSRELMQVTNKERGNITRSLYDLSLSNKVQISHKDKCPVTGRTVRYYSLNTDPKGTA